MMAAAAVICNIVLNDAPGMIYWSLSKEPGALLGNGMAKTTAYGPATADKVVRLIKEHIWVVPTVGMLATFTVLMVRGIYLGLSSGWLAAITFAGVATVGTVYWQAVRIRKEAGQVSGDE